MLDIKYVRQNIDLVDHALKRRRYNADLKIFQELDEKHRAILSEIEQLRFQRNTVSGQIAKMAKNAKETNELKEKMRGVSSRIKTLETELTESESAIKDFLLTIPNSPHESIPDGKDSDDNQVVKQNGDIPAFSFTPLAHWDIGENLNILDFQRASKITGARFPLYFGVGAKLERALINFMLDIHTTNHGYLETLPPFIVNRDSMTATGQLPKFEEDLFKLDKWDYFLVPTAEVPVTNIYRNEILEESDFPFYFTAYTPCFRSEAGSYGKDTRGLIRQHQFNKVELVKLVLPETSYDELESLLNHAETILQKLKLPYQVVNLCTGDIGFSAAKTYDIEVWMPAQNVYREISSCSNFEDYQARRADIRFKRKGKKGTEFVHTLNGSGLAVGRTFAAILENYQQKDGTVVIPEVLRPYMNGLEIIEPKK